jgi:hypothetical protein
MKCSIFRKYYYLYAYTLDINVLFQCSVTCGVGMQYRKVHCNSKRLLCPPSEYPHIAKPCHTGVVCPYANKTEVDESASREAEGKSKEAS